jgi:hypothetical protein
MLVPANLLEVADSTPHALVAWTRIDLARMAKANLLLVKGLWNIRQVLPGSASACCHNLEAKLHV